MPSSPRLNASQRVDLVARFHEANLVTACQFCNSTTSRDRAAFTMEEAIALYRAFRDEIRPALLKRRDEEPALRESRDLSGLDVIDTAPTEGPEPPKT